MNKISENLQLIHKNIMNACAKAKRPIDDVKLISVTKTRTVEELQFAYDCGERLFGENKVQEIINKYDKLPNDIEWHMIGHLQTNKIKYIIDKVSLIHSVDTYHLASAISKEAIKHNIVMPILVELNIGNEESKFGISKEEAIELVESIAILPGISVKGLMTVAPYVEDPEENRQYFAQMKELSVDISRQNIDNVTMDILSMGMSGDYMVAIEEGATYVRIGTSIFGQRNYNI